MELDEPRIGATKGDIVVQLLMDVPPPRGEALESTKDLTARWIVKNGHAMPDSGWAKQLQNGPPPLMWLNC